MPMIFDVVKMTIHEKSGKIMLMNMESIPSSIHVSVTLLSQMFLYLASLGLDVDAFLQSIGIDPQSLKSPDVHIPVETYLFIQEEAIKRTRDEYFGLHMGEYAEPGSWSILGYMMMNCKNLGQAFEKAGRYSRIIGNLIEATGVFQFNKVKVVFFTPPHAPKMTRHCYESTLSSTVRMLHTLTGKDIRPVQVGFSYPEPTDSSEYDRVFGCLVLFNQKETFMTLDIKIAKIPVLLSNPALLEHFESYAQEFITKMEHTDEYTRAVMRIILANLDDEKLSIKEIAKEMAVSVRTLQKRLEEEGVVFSELLRSVRAKLAKQYLTENYTVEQITYLLGFSEPSVFRKAFKKWAGMTPREFRERSFSTLTTTLP
ncbi:MAG: AraC family transcriptional regulator [Anaerolineaceae bacterium]|nr:AraC family transcriptional regulator [Anaerolineaceae bacterium]